MFELTKRQLLADRDYKLVFEAVKKSHRIAEHTAKNLLELKEVPDVCEETCHFTQIGEENPIYIHYITTTWIQNLGNNQYNFPTRIDRIGFYVDFLEYETARLKMYQFCRT